MKKILLKLLKYKKITSEHKYNIQRSKIHLTSTPILIQLCNRFLIMNYAYTEDR